MPICASRQAVHSIYQPIHIYDRFHLMNPVFIIIHIHSVFKYHISIPYSLSYYLFKDILNLCTYFIYSFMYSFHILIHILIYVYSFIYSSFTYSFMCSFHILIHILFHILIHVLILYTHSHILIHVLISYTHSYTHSHARFIYSFIYSFTYTHLYTLSRILIHIFPIICYLFLVICDNNHIKLNHTMCS